MADDKPEERRYRDKPKPATDAAEERGESTGERRAEAAGGRPEGAAEAESDLRTRIFKAQEKERRDLHGQHRDAMRQMHARHEAQYRELNDMASEAAEGGGAQDGAGAGG